MIVTSLAIPDVKLITPRAYRDQRGEFYESFSAKKYAAFDIVLPFVQDNVSHSVRGVLRGLHLQWPSNTQGKLVSVVAGAVWDVAIDLRSDSPTFRKWVAAELTSDNHNQLWIPPGFGHGFVALSEHATFHYKCTAPYSPADELIVRWDDPTIGIEWPVSAPLLSERDARAPFLADIPSERLPSMSQLDGHSITDGYD